MQLAIVLLFASFVFCQSQYGGYGNGIVYGYFGHDKQVVVEQSHNGAYSSHVGGNFARHADPVAPLGDLGYTPSSPTPPSYGGRKVLVNEYGYETNNNNDSDNEDIYDGQDTDDNNESNDNNDDFTTNPEDNNNPEDDDGLNFPSIAPITAPPSKNEAASHHVLTFALIGALALTCML